MTDPIAEFVAQSPPIDSVREDAARCCEETVRFLRGKRGPLRMPHGLINGEFCDAAFGVAAEVAQVVAESMRSAGQRFTAEFPWSTAAKMLRNGWQRGHRLVTYEIGKGPAP